MTGLFVIRNAYELDHLTPMISLLAQKDDLFQLLVLNENIAQNDYRLHHLETTGLTKIVRPHDLSLLSSDESSLATWLNLPCRGETGFIAFGWLRHGQYGLAFVKRLIAAATKLGIQTLCLPSEACSFSNRLVARSDTESSVILRHEPGCWVNRVFVTSDVCESNYRPWVESEHLIRTGYARYSNSWISTLTKIAPAFQSPEALGHIKIALFLPRYEIPANWDELLSIIHMLARQDRLSIAIKPDDQGAGLERLQRAYPALRELDATNIRFVGHTVDNISLVQWADWVLDAGTEAVFDAIALNKPFRLLDYLLCNRLVAAEFFPNTRIGCRDEVVQWMTALPNEEPGVLSKCERKAFTEKVIRESALVSRDDLFSEQPPSPRSKSRAHSNQMAGTTCDDLIAKSDLMLRNDQLLRSIAACHKMIAARDKMIQMREDYRNSVSRLVKGCVRICWERLAIQGVTNVILFGAGKHTDWLLHVTHDMPTPAVRLILDDAAIPGETRFGIPVLRPLDATPNGDPIILSTDTHQETFRARCQTLFGERIKLINLYEELQFPGPYPKGIS